MKTYAIIGVGLVIALTAGAIWYFESQNEPVEAVGGATLATTTIEQTEESRDVLEEAKRELDRINGELNTEEIKLLEERDAINARLEQIRETRMGFQ